MDKPEKKHRKLSISYLKKRWLSKKSKTTPKAECECSTESPALLKSLRRHYMNIFGSKRRIKAYEENYGFRSPGWNCTDYNIAPEVPPRIEPSVQQPTYTEVEQNNVITEDDQNGLTNELFNLTRAGWYWGPISPHEAENKLRGQPEGTFLVRDSSADHYLLSVSFRSSGKTLHSRIEYTSGMFSLNPQEGFPNISDLINHSITSSQSAVICFARPTSIMTPAYPVRLTKPLSRFMEVMSLQYLCRFVIRQTIAVDNINKLPISPILKKYLHEGYF